MADSIIKELFKMSLEHQVVPVRKKEHDPPNKQTKILTEMRVGQRGTTANWKRSQMAKTVNNLSKK